MNGMGKQYDGHTWCKTMTTNIATDFGLKFHKSTCNGHLRCPNNSCEFLCRNSRKVNKTKWTRVSLSPFTIGEGPPPKSTLACKVCHTSFLCLILYDARIYYVFSSNPNLTRAAIHTGRHVHLVFDGVCLDSLDLMYDCVAQEVAKTPNAKNFAIVMGASKKFLADWLLRPTPGQAHLQGASLDNVMDKFSNLLSPNIQNFVSGCKRFVCGGMGPMDSIMALKDYSGFKFIHENKFPGQSKGKVFVFKMSVDRSGSGVNLVKRMQPEGDLQDCWIMFDHVKWVENWTTMAFHVYDNKYCKVMTIAIYDMQFEDAEAHELFWMQLNIVMGKNRVDNVNFKGFMADSIQANWNTVWKVYGTGDPAVCMDGRERTCLFHWTLCLQRTITKNIKLEFHDQYKELCKQWKDAKTQEEAETRYNVIKVWWVSFGAATSPSAVRTLNDWMAFWHFRYRQWGGYMQLVSDPLIQSVCII